MKLIHSSCLLFIFQTCLHRSSALHVMFPLVTKAPFPQQPSNILDPRAISTELSTCGYLDGDPKKKRTADSGFNCRVDTRNGLWGFCPTTVLTASDCGLAGSCVDSHDCSDGCGMTDNEELTTFTCNRKSFCSMALLTFGVDQTYSYIACGSIATTDHYYITPTVDITSTKSETSFLTTSETLQTSSVASSETTTGTTETVQSTFAEASSRSSEDSSPSKGSSTNLGAIIGGVIGGLVVICGTIITAIFLLRRNRSRDVQQNRTGQNATKDSPFFSRWSKEKEPHELAGWNVHEMPADEHNERRNPVELDT